MPETVTTAPPAPPVPPPPTRRRRERRSFLPQSLDYVVRETGTNLRRNVQMSLAAVLTVTVSLTLLGVALLLKQGVTQATIQWRGGVELSIFLDPKVTANQREGLSRELGDLRDVKKVTYVDQQEAFEEFKVMFDNNPEYLENVTPEVLPPSFRVVPSDPETVRAIGARFAKREGVKDVAYAQDTIEALLNITRNLQLGIYLAAGALLLSAVLLILTTIQMAIFARRREIGVMKLVGATNWFIRVPFMVEGLIQGLIGAGAAFGVVVATRELVERRVGTNLLGNQLLPPAGDAVGTGIFLLVVGALVGAVGSAIAVSRFLDV